MSGHPGDGFARGCRVAGTWWAVWGKSYGRSATRAIVGRGSVEPLQRNDLCMSQRPIRVIRVSSTHPSVPRCQTHRRSPRRRQSPCWDWSPESHPEPGHQTSLGDCPAGRFRSSHPWSCLPQRWGARPERDILVDGLLSCGVHIGPRAQDRPAADGLGFDNEMTPPPSTFSRSRGQGSPLSGHGCTRTDPHAHEKAADWGNRNR